LDRNKHIRVVAKRDGIYCGEYRIVPLTIIAGELRTETEVREFGVRLRLDLQYVYYSIRSGTERRRIASLVHEGESVLVCFSGVGPYPLLISRYSRARRILAIEKNPIAHEYAEQNLLLNKKILNVEFKQADVNDLLPNISEQFDRIILPLPGRADSFLLPALRLLKKGGYLHYYDFQREQDPAFIVNKVNKACDQACCKIREIGTILCGHCGTHVHRICVDVQIE
jgi:tRNA (guanine37-N1)-methyltransferase